MAVNELTHLNIPLAIAESIHLTDAPAGPIKALLIAESQRAPGDDHADIPIRRARTMGGWTVRNLHGAVAGMAPILARWRSNPKDPGAPVPALWSPFAEPPQVRFDGEDERVVVRFSGEWLTACRGASVSVPLDDLRDLRRRAAVLLRLRMEAALHGRDTVRVRWPLTDLAMLSGRGGDIDPARHLVPDVIAGTVEIGDVSSTLSVTLDILTSRSGRAVDRFDPDIVTREGRTRGVVLRARRLRARRAKVAPAEVAAPTA